MNFLISLCGQKKKAQPQHSQQIQLNKEKPTHKVGILIGYEGSGKTTIVRKISNEQTIKHFTPYTITDTKKNINNVNPIFEIFDTPSLNFNKQSSKTTDLNNSIIASFNQELTNKFFNSIFFVLKFDNNTE